MRRPIALGVVAGVLGSVGLAGAPAVAAPSPAPVVASYAVAGSLTMDGFQDDDWWYEAMRIEQAHRKGATGEGATVALIDGPLAVDAPELQGQDITLRIDCLGNRAKPISPTLYSQSDEADHGTSMASLIVGSGRGNAPGGVGTAGVAPEARLLAYDATGGSVGLCRGDQVADLVDQAVADGADIISVSLGLDEGLNPAIRRAMQAGAVVVGAMPSEVDSAGNSRYPSGLPGVVAVQPVDRNADAPPWTSPHESAVIAAPGVSVGALAWNPATGRLDSLGYGDGTSQATAIVSGVLALVKSKHPDATGNQLIQHLIHHVGGEENFDWDGTYGFGIASVTEMLKSAPTQWPDENPLLDGPQRAVRDYPPWVSSKVEDPPGKGENAPQPDPEPAAADQTPDGADGDPAGDAVREPGRDAGIPGWVWPTAGLLALLVAGAAVWTRRRGGHAA